MKNNKSFEDIYRQRLDSLEIKPSKHIWTDIDKQMQTPRFEANCKNAFYGFKVDPSKFLWRRIVATTWVENFLHFAPFSFNLYYLIAILTTFVGVFISVNNTKISEYHFFDESKYLLIQDTLLMTESNMKAEDLILLTTPDKSLNVKDFSEHEFQYSEKNSSLTNNDPYIAVVQENENEQNNYFNLFENFNETITTLFKMPLLFNFKLTPKPSYLDIAEQRIMDFSIIKDTVAVNYLGEPILIDKSWFEFGLYFNPQTHYCKIKTNNVELNNEIDFYNNGYKPLMSYSLGLKFAYNYKNLRLESGLGYSSIASKFDNKVKKYEAFDIYLYEHFNHPYWQYDTTYVLDLDEYLHGNIVYYSYIDSIQSFYQDSVLTHSLDSVLTDKFLKASSNYSYISLPVLFSYNFNYENFVFNPKLGVLFSYLVQKNGFDYNIQDRQLSRLEMFEYRKFAIDYYLGLSFGYKFAEHYLFYIEPNYSAAISSRFKSSYPLNFKTQKIGLQFGINYKF